MLGALRETNGFIRLEETSGGFAAGERVTAVPLRLDLF
jgi:molybdopterin biosynthesis enzyme